MTDRPVASLRPPLPVATYTAAIRTDADLLATAAASTGLDTGVPTCPEWDVRQLVRHLGGVHRWATQFAAGRADPDGRDLEEVVGGWPSDSELVAWLLDGAERLATTLDTADPDLRCWTFLRATSPRVHWARRQAHETAIHRVDAEVAAAATATPFAPAFAADGIDELLVCFITRRTTGFVADPARTMRVTVIDTSGDWDVVVGPTGVTTVPGGSGPADATVTGEASDLYQALWNRPTTAPLGTAGDSSLLARFLDGVHVRW